MTRPSPAPRPPANPYHARHVRFLRLAELNDWRVKVYGISAHGERPDPAAISAAEQLARELLPAPAIWAAAPGAGAAVSEDRYGVAILIVHKGREGTFLLLNWWAGENMLQHRVYLAPPGQPHEFSDITPTGVLACVWELAVLAFECNAWIETVLADPAAPNLDAYLARRMSADI